MISIQHEDFDVASEYQSLRRNAGDAGAIATFTGLVREFYSGDDEGEDAIVTLTLEHYPGMTEKHLQAIVDQSNTRWDLLATRIIHRVGKLRPGDQIVFVGTASAHRQAAFAACEFIMDFLKSRAPFWKKQETGRGSHWVQARETDAGALQRWQQERSNS